jgi:UDP-3-O-[3-hydroxymyristoyl] glucosamine N-acyltransferase
LVAGHFLGPVEEEMSAKTLNELARHVNGTVQGDGSVIIESAATLSDASAGQISFLANDKYEKQVLSTKASAVIVKKAADIAVPQIVSEDPYYAFMQIVVLLHGHRRHKKTGLSQRASISETADIGKDCDIFDFVTVSDRAKIGARCKIYPGVFIGEDVVIGDDCIIYPNAAIYAGCKIGNRVIVNANSSIGQDGFGFATHGGKHHKIPQIGAVVLADDVEVGVSCGIERGTLSDTVIGEGTKIGDQVTIGHGTRIGSHCLLVAQIGVSGSTNIGDYCVIGGQVGIVGHITIGNRVTIAAQAGVINSIPDGATILGSPAIEINQGRRAYSMIQFLPEMRQNIRQLQKRIASLFTDKEDKT